MSPIGNPLLLNPHGSEIAGIPSTLNGLVFDVTSGFAGAGSCARFISSSSVGGRIRCVGSTTRSKSEKASSTLRRSSSISHFVRM